MSQPMVSQPLSQPDLSQVMCIQGSKLTFMLSCPWDNHKSCFGCPIESFGCPTPPYVGFHERDFGKGVTDLNDA